MKQLSWAAALLVAGICVARAEPTPEQRAGDYCDAAARPDIVEGCPLQRLKVICKEQWLVRHHIKKHIEFHMLPCEVSDVGE
jgi:hypothetical protein